MRTAGLTILVLLLSGVSTLPGRAFTIEDLEILRKNYVAAGQALVDQRTDMAATYHESGSERKVKVIAEAREMVLSAMVEEILPPWLGTPWDFNGTSRISGEGLFLVGLDRHTGFLINRGGRITFFHSNYYEPLSMVMNQEPGERGPFADSKYRVFARLLDGTMMKKWLGEERSPVTHNHFRQP